MTERVAREETLFTVPESVEAPPEMLCGHCTCGHAFFPPHLFGCEACGAGAGELSIIPMKARGVLKALAAAHRDSGPDGSPPRVFGEILLEEGPCILATLNIKNGQSLKPGERVCGTLISAGKDASGRTIVDCVFVAEKEAI